MSAEEFPDARDALRRHLLTQHGRTPNDLAGLPLAAVHRFEHVEQALGLIELDHPDDDVPVPVT